MCYTNNNEEKEYEFDSEGNRIDSELGTGDMNEEERYFEQVGEYEEKKYEVTKEDIDNHIEQIDSATEYLNMVKKQLKINKNQEMLFRTNPQLLRICYEFLLELDSFGKKVINQFGNEKTEDFLEAINIWQNGKGEERKSERYLRMKRAIKLCSLKEVKEKRLWIEENKEEVLKFIQLNFTV